jgi:hypothetical protein
MRSRIEAVYDVQNGLGIGDRCLLEGCQRADKYVPKLLVPASVLLQERCGLQEESFGPSVDTAGLEVMERQSQGLDGGPDAVIRREAERQIVDGSAADFFRTSRQMPHILLQGDIGQQDLAPPLRIYLPSRRRCVTKPFKLGRRVSTGPLMLNKLLAGGPQRFQSPVVSIRVAGRDALRPGETGQQGVDPLRSFVDADDRESFFEPVLYLAAGLLGLPGVDSDVDRRRGRVHVETDQSVRQ